MHSPTRLDAHGNPIAGDSYDMGEDVLDAEEVAPLEVFDAQREAGVEETETQEQRQLERDRRR